MRDREQRLRWIETLIGGNRPETDRRNALVMPTPIGNIAVEFPSIVEVLSGAHVRPFAFLPEKYIGVVLHGSSLVPVLDSNGELGEAAHVVIVEGGGCLLGLRFFGTPHVVDLNETEHELLELGPRPQPARGKLPLLDVEKTIEILLAKD